MKPSSPRSRKALQRLIGDIQVLTDREADALERRDFQELESAQEKKALLTDALTRHWSDSGGTSRMPPELADKPKDLLEASRRNQTRIAGMMADFVDSACANAAVSDRLHAVRGRYTIAPDRSGKLSAKG